MTLRVPPAAVRRLVVAPLVLALEAAVLVLGSVLAVPLALLGPRGGARRPLRVTVIAVVYAGRHLAGTLACLGLWVAGGFGRKLDGPRMQRAHYAVLGWFVAGLHESMSRAARVALRVEGSDAALGALTAKERPVVVLARHAGEGDSLLVLHHLLCRHGRRTRLVLHEALRIDPLIDALGSRLPNRFVDPRGGETEVEIAAMAGDMGPDDAVLIFPEGANFSAEHRERGIARLRRGGHHGHAEQADAMRHVSPPRPGGALAAIDAARDADVVFVGHVGTPTGVAGTWRLLPETQPVLLRLWVVPAEEVPRDRAEQVTWLFEHWAVLDAWVAERSAAA